MSHSTPRKERRSFAERRLITSAIAEIGRCERCGGREDLQGHHKVPRSVDLSLAVVRSNIEVLCATCHAAEHFPISGFIFRPPRRKGVTLICDRCSKPFYVKLSQAHKVRNCSKECRKSGETKPCEICGTLFYAKRKHLVRGEGRFCSLQCFGKKNGILAAGVRWKDNPRRQCICETCGKYFDVTFSNPARFCSSRCFGISQGAKLAERNRLRHLT